ncbi:MAG TPA: TonB-dependent receptor plug domain-containing protein, partial [Longimicrobium sp.]|nr:TonB-dependent receptor plug domain-containing protein [Longimicrobium sp.]
MKHRLKPLRLSALLAAALLFLAAESPAAAQDTIPRPRVPARVDSLVRARPDTVPPRPVPRDTVPEDSLRVGIPPEAIRGDTLPDRQDTVPPDSTIAARSFPAHPLPPALGFAAQSWLWGRNELQYFHGLSVADLLERIPGLIVTRSGSFGQPPGVSPFVSGGGRFRIFLDGYELRPMDASLPDLQRVPLVNLESMRVERGLHQVRVDLVSFRHGDIRPLAMVEGMDGDFDSRALRGFFSRPLGSKFVGEIGLDLVETDGYRRSGPFGATNVISRLSYAFTPDVGLQVEYRQGSVDRERRDPGGGGG